MLSACTSEDRSKEVLVKSGFTDITVGGYDWLTCSKSDRFHTHFKARNAQGLVVEGTVCCGWLKSCTVRF